MASHSSTLPWKIPGTEEPGRLQPMGLLWVGHNWATSLSLFTFMHWRRKWQPTPVFFPGESQGRGSLVGCHLWGQVAPKFKVQALGLTLAGPPLPIGHTFRNHFIKFTSYFYSTKYNAKHYAMLCYAKSLQSCPTLCDPIDSSPPGSPVPGILQGRTLEWAAISFSNAWKWKVKVKSLSHVQPSATPWIAA